MTIRLLAPAKINLGLEILGRRSDGYHEIRTILAAISMADELLAEPASATSLDVDQHELAGDDNLVLRAAVMLGEQFPQATARFALRKRIPAASGLGGASSDAVAALIALNELRQLGLTPVELERYAARIGSDPPFFVRGGCALASGRGDVLTPLPAPASLSVVVVSPNVAIPQKTATLYGALTPADFSDGKRVQANAAALTARLDDDLCLDNAFSRPLYALAPSLRLVSDALHVAGAGRSGLSGAGPSHYALERDPERAEAIAAVVRAKLGPEAAVNVHRLIASGVTVHTYCSG